ncbi:hypothetical protein B1729_07475 [Microbacterium sp. B35-04]|uniref:hypothetical protein n=1 Tax=Microbacterium sp. B35-04 TaxID=1961716 RepID=UPI0013D555C7|nr:hypothetical protein [Microbacterium sp. B35-04]KAF2413894.1 hypothetical protein B1729_07475 [Microbacterium sp. B35-04]
MKVLDVTARIAAIAPEDAGAASFTFLPYHRTGAAAGIRRPVFSTAAGVRTTVDVSFALTDGAGTETVSQPITLRGPGDVVGVDPAQIIRRHPEPGTGDAPTGDLVHIEFDTPDLPWMFTPAAPSAGRLPPWLRLVVVPTASIVRDLAPAGPDLPPAIEVPRAELPPPGDAWAWAHAQVSGKGHDAAALAGHLGSGSPQLNLSRLVSPTRLRPRERWTALVVPTFDAGRRAGLRESPIGTLAWAWDPNGPDTVVLPVYDRWEFATGEARGFEELARAIVPVPAADGLGRRWVDTSQPGSGITVVGEDGPRPVHGALIAPTASGEPEPSDDGRWDAAATTRLRALVDASTDPAADPEVGPPLYGGAHLLADALPADAAEPGWLSELNLDPAHRIAAALGTAVVQMDQEPLMAAAWSQLQNLREANEVLRAAQFARIVSTALHRRTIERMPPPALLAATARAHAQVDLGGVTVRATVAASALPHAAVGGALRRLARPLGRTARFIPPGERVQASERLIADGELGADWVLPVPAPDARKTSELMVRLEEGDASLLSDVGAEDESVALLTELIDALPTPDEVRALEDEPGLRLRLEGIAAVLGMGWKLALSDSPWALPAPSVARFPDAGVDPTHPDPFDTDLLDAGVFSPVMTALEERGFEGVHPLETEPSIEELRGLAERPSEEITASFGEAFTGEFAEPVEPPRERLDIAGLDLVGRLRPFLTLPRRARTRLPGLAGLFGRDPDDLDDVLAAPEFRHPLYEALSRYDREWLMPGVAAIPEPEMVTALQTNAVFVESFLVGANHEFARELVWREYPTDGRATSLRRFWTPAPDLLAGIHTMRTGGLGTHLDPARAGRLVFVVRGELVRRFPNVLANVAASTNADYPVGYVSRPVPSLFRLALAPNLLLVAVDLTAVAAVAADAGPPEPPTGAFWFTLAEHVGAPRFGLDETATPAGAPTPKRDDLAWDRWLPSGGRHLPATVPATTDAPDVPETSAKVAWALFQKPARVGFRVRTLVDDIFSEREDDDG